MVYDPIRDREVPTPTSTNATPDHWRYPTDQQSSPTYQEPPRDYPPRQSRPPSYSSESYSPPPPPPPPAPGPSSLRGLLNTAPLDIRRGSDRTPSVSSVPDEIDDVTTNGQRGSRLRNLLNETPGQPLSKTNSTSSLPRSSPSNPSPGSRQRVLDPNSFLTPATPASGYPHSRSTTSHSPHPQYSPQKQNVALIPQGYPAHDMTGYGEPSHYRRESGGQRPMLPPQHPMHPNEYHDYERRTPSGTGPPQHVPTRSPSFSVSPRSQHQTLPYTSSRPGSSASASHPFAYQPAYQSATSPTTSSRRMSEEPPRPTSSSSAAGRRYTEHATPGHPTRRSSQASITGYSAPRLTPIRSPSPIPEVRGIPYQPNRYSAPGSILHPITSEEVAHLHSIAQNNNPLRRRKRNNRPLPSWSGPSPGPRQSLPSEADNSYFPPQSDDEQAYRRSANFVERRGSITSSGRPSVTPTPGAAYAASSHHGYPPAFDDPPLPAQGALTSRGKPPRKRTMGGNGDGGNHLKRSADRDEEDGHDMTRRKVSETQYVGNVAAVANHYNARPEIGVEGREFSPIIGLKKFNNWIKSVLIGKFAYRQRGKVLDIGCGKGGDLNKWKQARIALYVGLDLAETSVEQAAERYSRMQRANFDAYFFAHDCYSKALSDILPEHLQVKDLYDNVTMQFCMHYAFESASKARMMIENVSRYLRKGGVFIGTIPNAELLLSRLNDLPEDDEELRFGNSCYYVQFTERKHKGIYGHQYRFFLTDAVEDVPEYLVDWENFEALAMEYKLKIVYKKPFHDILQDEQASRDFGPLLGKMGVVNADGESAMDADQWEAANLYMAFAFEKV
ncbi:hypothetical protein CI109_101038 [Kwoniella shandongensis]|uniref:mRNA cap guanine-N(7) methyltransferase n=1 Tax=Kwoniella shandongensis TaxID=1734106 RepID=A0A5M6C536_9TREE|nr:uncharacterized protein CI109_001507 [Kwoniella shandongensis]KAA5530103.1 hypothetical protein CI109_001507 [Kwoniella shandongensis]